MGKILMKMAVLLKGNAFCVDGHRGVAGFPGDPILSTQRIPRGRDRILSTQRLPRGRDRILSTQRIFYKKNHEKSTVCFKTFSALRALIC